MIIALGDIYTKVAFLEEAVQLLRRTQAEVRAQPGCLGYVFAEVVGEPGHFVLTQEWRDQAAFDQHYRSAEFAGYQRRIESLLSRDSELRVHHVTETIHAVKSAAMDPRDAD